MASSLMQLFDCGATFSLHTTLPGGRSHGDGNDGEETKQADSSFDSTMLSEGMTMTSADGGSTVHTFTAAASADKENVINKTTIVSTSATTTKVQKTRTTFGQKGCGRHKEHHLWQNRIPLPKDLRPNEVLVRVMSPDDEQIMDDQMLELATLCSHFLGQLLRKVFTATEHDARFVLKIKVTTISDGTVNGSVAANKGNPATGFGYAGIGICWKLLSNELTTTTGMQLKQMNYSNSRTKKKKSNSNNRSFGGSLAANSFATEDSSFSSSSTREVPYEPIPYDGGFEVIEQSLDYVQLFAPQNYGIGVLTTQLVPECCASIIKRIGINVNTTNVIDDDRHQSYSNRKSSKSPSQKISSKSKKGSPYLAKDASKARASFPSN